jgi:hypothetical protein
MQLKEIFAFDIPMRLFGLRVQIERVRQLLVEQLNQSAARIDGKIDAGLEHSRLILGEAGSVLLSFYHGKSFPFYFTMSGDFGDGMRQKVPHPISKPLISATSGCESCGWMVKLRYGMGT